MASHRQAFCTGLVSRQLPMCWSHPWSNPPFALLGLAAAPPRHHRVEAQYPPHPHPVFFIQRIDVLFLTTPSFSNKRFP